MVGGARAPPGVEHLGVPPPLTRDVAVVGVGWYGFRPYTGEVSFREMMFEAALRAYRDAGVDAREDVDAFVSCQEDFWEGIAIADEFAPEPIGGVLRPTFTVAGDGLQGVAQAYMMIKSGVFDVVAVEAHAKPSDIESLSDIYRLALDPYYHRVLPVGNPHFTAGLDADAYLRHSGASREHLAMVAVKNKNNGLLNPRAPHASPVTLADVLEAPPYIEPLTRYEAAPFTDAAIVVVLAAGEVAERLTDKPVWIRGIGWATETGTGSIEWHAWGRMPSIRAAAAMAYAQAGISDPARQTDFAEVEDRFAHMELIALEEAMLAPEDHAHRLLEQGYFSRDGAYPVNPSGGSLSMGVTLEATGLARLLEAVLQLRGEAGPHQLDGVERAVVVSWRGPPTTTSMVAVLEGPGF